VAHPDRGGFLKTVAIRLAQLTATVVVTWFVADRVAGLGLTEVRALELEAWALNWPLLVASCAVLLFGYFLSAWLWGRIVSGLGGRTMPASEVVPLYMVANLGRYVPGKVWQVAALATLARQRGIPAATATAAAVLLQGIAIASALLVGVGSLWTLADGAAWRWAVPAGVIGALVLGLTPAVFHFLTESWFRVTRTPEPPALQPTDALGWLALGLLNWVVYAGAFWVMVEGLGLDVAFFATSSAFAAAYVVGYLAIFAPAGVGVREASLLALLSPQLGAGTAGAVAVIARVWTTGVEVVPAAAFWARHIGRPLEHEGRPLTGGATLVAPEADGVTDPSRGRGAGGHHG
jgi:uncharacterized membrane protein YbhN (UPF0104 family)